MNAHRGAPAGANGVIVASWLKRDGVWWNPVDPERLAAFMRVVSGVRSR